MLAVSSSLEYAHFDNWMMAVRLAQLELVFSRSDNNHIVDFGVNNEKKKKKKKSSFKCEMQNSYDTHLQIFFSNFIFEKSLFIQRGFNLQMFRSVIAQQRSVLPRLAIPRILSPVLFCSSKSFHSSSPCLAKRKNKKSSNNKNNEELDFSEKVDEIPEVTIDFQKVTSNFDNVLAKFNKAATDIKLGKLNPKIFDNLEVNIGNHGQEELVPFTSVAQTSVKGRNFIINLFDASYGKHVINSIIGSGLNMSGTIDPTNKFQIKVPIPNITAETKQENIKQLKEIFENLKNNHKSSSLNYVRSEARNKFQSGLKHNKISDNQHQLLKKLETLHKTYVDKLTDAFKQAEKSILK